ncbi:type II toxin-antitoxin system HigB family toxin [Geovibrio sp. ADMFC3]|nr:addiction module toxin RelE [Deferribacteraceae bacterium]
MRIIARKTIIDFYTLHPDSKNALEAWFFEAKQAKWNSFNCIKDRYRSASLIAGNRVIFNICGNKYRLIVKIHYTVGLIYIRFIGTHKEYDKINAAEV